MPQWPLARSRKAYPAFESSAPGGRAPGLSRGWGFKSSGRETRPSGNHLDLRSGEPRAPRRLPALGADSSRALPGGYAAFPPRREPGPPGVQQRLRRKAYPAVQAERLTPEARRRRQIESHLNQRAESFFSVSHFQNQKNIIPGARQNSFPFGV